MKKIEAWLSNNNVIYTNKEDCANADGLVKCKKCNSTGLEKYEHITPYPSGLPDSGWVDDTVEIKTRTCSRCDGIGYVKNNIEDDPEFQQYLKLKHKFEESK